jgi:hypothetical protein
MFDEGMAFYLQVNIMNKHASEFYPKFIQIFEFIQISKVRKVKTESKNTKDMLSFSPFPCYCFPFA